jgi:hypothetical protein
MSFLQDGSPCPTCSPTPEDARHAFEVAERVKNAKPAKTITVLDDPSLVVDPDEVGTDAIGAGFAPGAIAAQQERDLRAMRGGR